MFIARYLLECAGKDKEYSYSAVFDLESFLWTFVYVLLRQNSIRRKQADTDILKRMIPERNRTYQADASAKASLMDTFSARFADPTGVLFLYQEFFNKLTKRAKDLFVRTQDFGFKAYEESEAYETTETHWTSKACTDMSTVHKGDLDICRCGRWL